MKELYTDQVVQNMVYRNNPGLALIRKFTEFGGKYKPIPIITGASQGRSTNFTNAQNNQSPVQIQSFLLTRATDYSLGQIDNQTMLAMRTDKMAFLEGAKVVVDGVIRASTLSAASSLFRSGTGSIGQVNTSGWTAGVATLTNATDGTQFERNMVLQANATDGGGSPRSALGYVIAVDHVGGTVTVASSGLGGTAATPSGWAASDYLLQQGDNNGKMSGFASWIPTTAPASTDSFFGVNRSQEPVRLAGVRYDGSAQSIEEALTDGAGIVAQEGGSPEVAFMTYASYRALQKGLGAKVEYIDMEGPAQIMFRGIRINGPNGEIKVIPDRSCLALTCFMLQMDTWSLESLGDVPMILRYGDNLEMLRVSTSDASEVRCGYYANPACNAPGWNANVKLGV